MGLLAALRERFHDEDVSLDLDDIQALILRNRPEPYFGLHAMLHVDDPAGGRDLMARLAPHIPSAAGFTEDLESWTGVAVSFAGLQALGLPEESLASFPMAFQQGMAARADILRDVGENAPEHWDEGFRDRRCHIALTIYAADEGALARAVGTAMDELDASSGVTLLGTHAFGADEEAKNPFGFRDGIAQPTIKGSGVEPSPATRRPSPPASSSWARTARRAAHSGVPQPTSSGATAAMSCSASS
jgi:deferrochelatase/peroxidase EfeB